MTAAPRVRTAPPRPAADRPFAERWHRARHAPPVSALRMLFPTRLPF